MKAEVCPNCGTRPSDWFDESGRPLDNPPLEAVPMRCFGCAETDRIRDTIPPKQRGVYVNIVPRDTFPRLNLADE